MHPLNPSLYAVLNQRFYHVTIADEGSAMIKSYCLRYDGSQMLRPHSAGEYYRINCPFCNDTRQRLWINHLWGVYDPETKTYNRWLAICYNEGCLSDPENLEQLIHWTDHYYRRARARQVVVTEGSAPPPGKPVALPPDFVCLHDLPQDHPAVQYVMERKFNPEELSKTWGIGFSLQACSWSPLGRLLIPIFRGSKVALEYFGWQARALVPNDDPKYYTAHGLKKSQVLYGLHRVTEKGPAIIVEGPTDAWRVGRNAIALLGKTASSEQLKLIREHLVGRPLVVMLDSDAESEARHLVEQLASQRRRSLLRTDSARVVLAELPPGLDPGDCTRAELQMAWKNAL
jgi:hypothetical protein